MDLAGHITIWYAPVGEGSMHEVFRFPEDNVRIDYPVWSPDGEWVLFDRYQQQGADIWVLDVPQ